MAAAPAGQEKSGSLVAPQLLQRWGSDHPNLKLPILHLDRASGPLYFSREAAVNFSAPGRVHSVEAPPGPE
jgi:hypothetical protein